MKRQDVIAVIQAREQRARLKLHQVASGFGLGPGSATSSGTDNQTGMKWINAVRRYPLRAASIACALGVLLAPGRGRRGDANRRLQVSSIVVTALSWARMVGSFATTQAARGALRHATATVRGAREGAVPGAASATGASAASASGPIEHGTVGSAPAVSRAGAPHANSPVEATAHPAQSAGRPPSTPRGPPIADSLRGPSARSV